MGATNSTEVLWMSWKQIDDKYCRKSNPILVKSHQKVNINIRNHGNRMFRITLLENDDFCLFTTQKHHHAIFHRFETDEMKFWEVVIPNNVNPEDIEVSIIIR